MALLTLAKPATLSPQPTLADPNLTEAERAGPRRVQPEKGSKEARRRELSQASVRQGRRPDRNASPAPSTSSSVSPPDGRHPSSAAAAAPRDGSSTPTLSSSSSIRSPSPANSLAYGTASTPATPGSSGFSSHTVEVAAGAPLTAPPTPATANGSQFFSTVSLMLEEPHAALPKALWKADADADVCDRDGCNVRFGMFTARKHHCRKCGLIFCSSCTAETHPLLFPRTFASALTSPLQSRNPSPSSSFTAASHLLGAPLSATASGSASAASSRPPTPPLSDAGTGGSGTPTASAVPSSTTAAAAATTPTRQVAVVTSRVCIDCKKSLSSPACMRPTIASRRSSARSTTPLRTTSSAELGGGGGGKDLNAALQPLQSLADAIQLCDVNAGFGSRGLDSPDPNSSSRSRNRSLSPAAASLFPSASANTSPRLSNALPSSSSTTGVTGSNGALPRLHLASLPAPSPFGTRSPAATPHEPWMDGPLGEFPLAYARRDGPVFDPNVHQAVVVRSRSQLRMKPSSSSAGSVSAGSRSRQGSIAGSASSSSVKEDDLRQPPPAARRRQGSHDSAASSQQQQSPPSQPPNISPQSNSTVPEDESSAERVQYNWSTF